MARVRMEMNGMVEGWSTKNRFKCLVFFFYFPHAGLLCMYFGPTSHLMNTARGN